MEVAWRLSPVAWEVQPVHLGLEEAELLVRPQHLGQAECRRQEQVGEVEVAWEGGLTSESKNLR